MTKPQRATPHARGQFQSTPSVWRETPVFDCFTVVTRISIHSLRVEGDGQMTLWLQKSKSFQSTPSVWRETEITEQA